VTDRRRLCPGDAWRDCLLRQIRFAVEAEVDVVQIRERDLATAELVALVRDSVLLASGSLTRVVVNDRLDVALAGGAAGVHLRGDSIPPAAVRAMVPPGFVVGQSVRDAESAIAAAPYVDYLIAGTVWPSESKDAAAALLGEEGLGRISRSVTRPVVAIGGIDRGRLGAVARSGAAGAAGIGLFMGAPGGGAPPGCRAISLSHVVRDARPRR
jgi:thiamine-phosphate diphosphorylase